MEQIAIRCTRGNLPKLVRDWLERWPVPAPHCSRAKGAPRILKIRVQTDGLVPLTLRFRSVAFLLKCNAELITTRGVLGRVFNGLLQGDYGLLDLFLVNLNLSAENHCFCVPGSFS